MSHAQVTVSASKGGKGKNVRHVEMSHAENGVINRVHFHAPEAKPDKMGRSPYMEPPPAEDHVFNGPNAAEDAANHACGLMGGGAMVPKGKGAAKSGKGGKAAGAEEAGEMD